MWREPSSARQPRVSVQTPKTPLRRGLVLPPVLRSEPHSASSRMGMRVRRVYERACGVEGVSGLSWHRSGALDANITDRCGESVQKQLQSAFYSWSAYLICFD